MKFYESIRINGSLSTLYNIRAEKQNKGDFSSWRLIHNSCLFFDSNRIYAVQNRNKTLLEIDETDSYKPTSLDDCETLDKAKEKALEEMRNDIDIYARSVHFYFVYKSDVYCIHCQNGVFELIENVD